MIVATVGLLVIIFLPFLLSLGAKGGIPKMFCFVASLMTLLLTVEPGQAFLPWVTGMVIAVVALLERFCPSCFI